MTHIAYVGLGSNLNQPMQQLQTALDSLRQWPALHLLATSKFYQSPPLDHSEQPDYVNAVAKLETVLSPHQLLAVLQVIEVQQGRKREGKRWSARTLDLDLLLYDQLELQSADLILPHHGLYQRNFVLYPLFDCEPELQLPDGRWLSEVLETVSMGDLRCLDGVLEHTES